MASTTTKNLFLQISANSDGLSRGAKAARIALADIGAGADDMQRAVQEAFQKLGGGAATQSASQLETAMRRTLSNIRAAAQETASQPLTAGGITNIGVANTERDLAATQARIDNLTTLGTVLNRLTFEEEATSAAARAMAATYLGGAEAARTEAVALEQQLAIQRQLQTALGATADAQDEVGAAHGRMSASGMIAQHVVRSTVDSFAAGLPPTMIFAEQIGRLGEAAALSGGAMGAFGEFMAGPFGLAITAGISVLGLLIGKLHDSHDAAELAKVGADGLADAQGVLGKMFDLTSGKLEHQNSLLRLNAQLTAINLRNDAVKERDSSADTFRQSGQLGFGSEVAAFFTRVPGTSPFTRIGSLQSNADKARALYEDVRTNSADPTKGVTPADALKQAENIDFRGLQITKVQFEQAIVDSVAADFKDKTADAIEKSLKDGSLDPSLREDAKKKKPKVDHSAERAANVDRAYQAQVDQAQEAYSRAMLGLSDTAQQRYEVEVQSLQDRLKQRLLEINDLVTAKKIPGKTAAEVQANADYLRSLAQQTKILEEQNALRKEMSDLLNQQFAVVKAQMDAGMTDLQLRLSGATGRRNQYAIAQQLLDKQQQADYADLINKMDPANMDVSETDRAKAYVDYLNLPTKQAQEKSNLAKQYASPGQSYLEQLRSSSGDMKDALQSVQVDGLKGLEDGLTGVITGTKSVQAAFKSMATSIIADLARIAIEREIITPIANALFPTSGAGGGGGGGILGLFSSVFGGHRAGGGPVSAGKVYRVGERGEEWFAPSTAGTIIPNHAIPQMASLSSADVRSLSRPQQPILISVRRGEMFEPYVHGAAAQHAQVAYTSATEDGANLAASRSAWSQGRALGGTR